MCNEMEKDIITLEFEDGVEVECEIVGVFEMDGQEYIALVAVETMENDESEVFIYRYKAVGEDEFEMDDITDDNEFSEAVETLSAILDAVEEDEEE